jgi:hypothetical protein
MSEKTRKYSKGRIGKLRVVEDFLPAPDELVPREDIDTYARQNEKGLIVRETNKLSAGRKSK